MTEVRADLRQALSSVMASLTLQLLEQYRVDSLADANTPEPGTPAAALMRCESGGRHHANLGACFDQLLCSDEDAVVTWLPKTFLWGREI